MSVGHAHGASAPSLTLPDDREARRARMRTALVITVAVLAAEIVGGILSHSLALLADAAHMFADIGALTLAYAAMTVATRAPTGRHTFGLYRAEVLAAFVNAEMLIVVALFIGYEAILRARQPVPVHTGLMLWVGLAALAGNGLSASLLAGGQAASLNVRAAYLEVFTDLLGAVAVVIIAIAIPWTGWQWLDPALSAAIALFILPRAVGLLRQTLHILLEGAPGEIDLPALRKELLGVPGVEQIHDLHFWTLTSGLHLASVHIRASSESPRAELLGAVQELLRVRAGVDHATIQVEWGSEMTCHSSSRGHA
ncbi:MAG TPA: cation diffusion facilitator family transporter [Thermoanaerobaculia bacterium]